MVCCLIPSPVSAQRVATLRLDGGAACVSVDRWRDRISAPGWQLVEGSQDGAQLALAASVSPEQDESLMVRLRVRWPDQREAERSVAAHSCEAALDALALFTQMTLDAAAHEPVQQAAAHEPWYALTAGWAGVSVAVSSGAAPDAQPGLGLFAGLDMRGAGLFQPRLQLELAHAWSNGHAEPAGQADFALDVGQLALCPITWRHPLLGAHGCGVIELGRLRARGYDTFEPRAYTRSWMSAGLGLLLSVPLWKLELQVAGALLHPLTRDQFAFAPEVFFSVPLWRWQLKVGVGVRFL